MRARSRRLLIAGVAVVVVAILVLALHARAPAPAAAQERGAAAANARVVPVQVAQVEQRDVPIWLEGLGSVAAWQQVTVRAQVDGVLQKVWFAEGQEVRPGDLLVDLDPRAFQVQLHQAEGALARDRAQLRDNRLNLERYTTLAQQKLIAPQQADDQRAQVGASEGSVRVDEAAIEAARLNLAYAHIRAPIGGIVGVRQVDPGNLVRASDMNGLVVITQLDPAAVFFTLPEDQLPALLAAQRRGPIPVEAWSRDGQTRLGVGAVTVIDNQINAPTATLRLKAAVPNPARLLWPNLFVKARALVDTQKGVLVVPAAAIQRGPQGTFVYVVGPDQTAAQQPVDVALTTADVAVLRAGLARGAVVVVEGQAQLRPGAKVSPRAAAAAPTAAAAGATP